MQFLLSRFSDRFYIQLPLDWIGWVGWVILLALVGLAAWRFRERNVPALPDLRHWLILAGCAAGSIALALILGIRPVTDAAIPMPFLPEEVKVPAVMIFSALPWVFAAGFFGPLPAMALGAISGLALALSDTHSLFLPLEIAAVALLFSVTVRQRYRTPVYRFLRHPAGAAFVLALATIPLFMAVGFFEVQGDLAVRLDYAITKTWPIFLTRGIELVLAGAIVEILLLVKSPFWPRPGLLLPSPAESSLQTRIFYTVLPMVLLLIFTLIITDWLVAGSVARQNLKNQLSSSGLVAAESLPYFMEAGQNLLLTLATPDLVDLPPAQLSERLGERLRSVPYFRQLFLFDANGKPVGGYPATVLDRLNTTADEQSGIGLALKGVIIQNYIIPPLKDETTAQISFLALINDSLGKPRGVLLGRTDLNSNPFTQPAIQALESVRKMGGEGVIVDENRRMLYNAAPALVMTEYYGRLQDDIAFFDDTAADGTTRLVFTQPVPGRDWTIVLSLPAKQAQQLALNIAVPLLMILLFTVLLGAILLRFSLRNVTASLQSLSQEAGRISTGELSVPMRVTGVDEVGRLSGAFEKMRLSLKARMDESNRLLLVSQGVASTLDIKSAVQPILEAALHEGGSSARLVLDRDVTLEGQAEPHVAYGLGAATDTYAYLDEQVFELMRHQESMTIPNTTRMRRISFPTGRPHPSAIMARSLYNENTYYGVLWLAHDQPHAFIDDEVRFFNTLAGQAALAAANARLYTTAEVGRQRLEAVLASTPEPVMVIDENNCLLLVNPAALQVPGLVSISTPGRPVGEVVPLPLLRDLLANSSFDRLSSQEISLPNQRIYFASVSPVLAEGQPVGKICIMQDITHYKELDSLKSDFVATVSHDLRSPLTLMKGYTTMLQMVGELNEQQKNYVLKMNQGVENMTRLVNNLLDLGRIEAGIDLQPEKMNLGEIVTGVVATLQPQASQKNITLAEETNGAQPVTVEADPALLQQAIYNLVDNAIKYTQKDGQVLVRIQPRAATVVVEVRDTGIGIAPLDLPRLFEKFFRSGRREAYQQRGTGLGLAIVKSIAERHNGRTWVDSTLGKGSSFYFEIPYQQKSGATT